MSASERGEWIQTYTGRKFYPFDPREEDVCIEDIAHALSVSCRFGGHCKRFYSVAEHSILVANLCDPEYKKYALLHDASEAYLVDLPSPIKSTLRANGIDIFDYLETRLTEVILRAFELTDKIPQNIHDTDKEVLEIERGQLMQHYINWQHSARTETTRYKELLYMTPKDAEQCYLSLFWSLTNA